MNRKGAMTDLIVLMIVAFVSLLFFGGWIYANNLLTAQLLTAGANSPTVNITDATQKTFVQINTGLSQLKWVSFAMIFGMILAIFVSSFLVRVHPVFLVLYFLFLIISIVFSAYISNAYEGILTNSVLSSTLSTFTASNYVMLYLPIWVTIIGAIGGILLFIGTTADKDIGGSLI